LPQSDKALQRCGRQVVALDGYLDRSISLSISMRHERVAVYGLRLERRDGPGDVRPL
jgi:hypothetical protein